MPPVDEAKEEQQRLWDGVEFRGAVDRGDVDKVDEMLTAGVNPNYKPDAPEASWSVLMLAANSGRAPLIDKLSKGGRMPKVEDRDPHGFQALMLAAYQGHVEIVKILLSKSADVNAKNDKGETPLMMAAAEGHKEVVASLLEAKANPDAVDSNEMSAIEKAARWGRSECLKLLLATVKEDPRKLKHCMLFGELFKHEEIVTIIKDILEPKEAIEGGEATGEDAEKVVAA